MDAANEKSRHSWAAFLPKSISTILRLGLLSASMEKKSQIDSETFFAPHLALVNVLDGMEFYKKAFGAIELRRWSNPDGSVHVAEMAIENAMFHLHEEVPRNKQFSPCNGKFSIRFDRLVCCRSPYIC